MVRAANKPPTEARASGSGGSWWSHTPSVRVVARVPLAVSTSPDAHTASLLASFPRRIWLADFTLHQTATTASTGLVCQSKFEHEERHDRHPSHSGSNCHPAVDIAIADEVNRTRRRNKPHRSTHPSTVNRQLDAATRHPSNVMKHAFLLLVHRWHRRRRRVCDVDKGGGVVVLGAYIHRHAVNSHLHDVNKYQPVSDPVDSELVLSQWQQLCRTTMTNHLVMDSARTDAILRDTAIPPFSTSTSSCADSSTAGGHGSTTQSPRTSSCVQLRVSRTLRLRRVCSTAAVTRAQR